MSKRTVSAFAGATLACGLVVACGSSSTPAGALLVAVDTNVDLPRNVDNVEIDVTDQSGRVYAPTMFALAANAMGLPVQKLPGTLAVVPGASPGEQVSVRLIGKLGSNVVFVRDADAIVPDDHIGVLRMVIDGLCFGDSSVKSVDASGGVTPTCPTTSNVQTCIAGGCDNVLVTVLETLDPNGPYSGNDDGSCFDVDACFHTSNVGQRGLIPVTTSRTSAGGIRCTIPVPTVVDPVTGASALASIDHLNIALPVASSFCANGQSPCLVPLDGYDSLESPALGWSVDGMTIDLPAGICVRSDGQPGFPAVFVTTSCARKTQDNPLCGAWDRVTTAESNDGGATVTSTVDGAAVLPDGAIVLPGSDSDGATDASETTEGGIIIGSDDGSVGGDDDGGGQMSTDGSTGSDGSPGTPGTPGSPGADGGGSDSGGEPHEDGGTCDSGFCTMVGDSGLMPQVVPTP